MIGTLASLTATLFAELVAPTRCAACDGEVRQRALFCTACATTIERADRRSAANVAAFEYGGAIATAIARLKYQGRPDLAPRLGRAMLDAATPLRGNVDLVVPVPLHPRRLAERGFNQAALLASPLARALGAPLTARVLFRTRDTPRQAAIEDRSGRLVSVEDAFSVRCPAWVAARRILLVDDVRTTGATLGACGEALREAGAARVLTLVLARRS